MKAVNRKILEQVIAAASEPVTIVRLDQADWPVVLANPAFDDIAGNDALKKPFADVIEQMLGRELALEISESLRSLLETSFPVEVGGREYLLALKPMTLPGESNARFYTAFWRCGVGGAAAEADAHHALLKAKRKIRDLTREDPVTGLLNDRAFRDVLEHDWAVAARERSRLSMVLFTLDDFAAYLEVFGRHAADSCLRRVGQTIRRCLRRASDVVARIDGSNLIVLSHTSDDDGVVDFAEKISTAVRELGLHHPRSAAGRFVTVSHRVGIATAGKIPASPDLFLEDLLVDRDR